MTDKEFKIEFAPGCFDTFEGTQDELEDLIDAIKQSVADIDWSQFGEEIDADDNTIYLDHIDSAIENRTKKLN